jgi:hypothetical protein
LACSILVAAAAATGCRTLGRSASTVEAKQAPDAEVDEGKHEPTPEELAQAARRMTTLAARFDVIYSTTLREMRDAANHNSLGQVIGRLCIGDLVGTYSKTQVNLWNEASNQLARTMSELAGIYRTLGEPDSPTFSNEIDEFLQPYARRQRLLNVMLSELMKDTIENRACVALDGALSFAESKYAQYSSAVEYYTNEMLNKYLPMSPEKLVKAIELLEALYSALKPLPFIQQDDVARFKKILPTQLHPMVDAGYDQLDKARRDMILKYLPDYIESLRKTLSQLQSVGLAGDARPIWSPIAAFVPRALTVNMGFLLGVNIARKQVLLNAKYRWRPLPSSCWSWTVAGGAGLSGSSLGLGPVGIPVGVGIQWDVPKLSDYTIGSYDPGIINLVKNLLGADAAIGGHLIGVGPGLKFLQPMQSIFWAPAAGVFGLDVEWIIGRSGGKSVGATAQIHGNLNCDNKQVDSSASLYDQFFQSILGQEPDAYPH